MSFVARNQVVAVQSPSSNPSSSARGGWRSRSRDRGRGRGSSNQNGGSRPPRPTHFLALPLHTHSTLQTRVSNFQNALLASDPPVAGLDPTIVIDPRRLHMTLGVMALESDDMTPRRPAEGLPSGPAESALPKTPSTALSLLLTLQPQISRILNTVPYEGGEKGGMKIPLDVLNVFPPGSTKGSSVLWAGPDMTGIIEKERSRRQGGSAHQQDPGEEDVERTLSRKWKERLWKVSDFVHQQFKAAGYITEQRPLTLHCTILNTSHRKRLPRAGAGEGRKNQNQQGAHYNKFELFSYEDVLKSEARGLVEDKSRTALEVEAPAPRLDLSSDGQSSSSVSRTVNNAPTSSAGSAERQPRSKALPINLGTYDVRSVELWVMGSRNANNEYVSLGGIPLE